MGIFGKLRKGLMIVVSGPAGAGKTTLVEMLIEQYPQAIARSISCTTRAPRGHEQNHQDYHFLSEKEFEKKISEGAFLEYAKVYNHYYGTLKKTVDDLQHQGMHLVLVIDTQGALNLKKIVDGVFVFIAPPSINTLKQRLEHRHTESSEAMNLRLSLAEKEMGQACYYDVVITNDNLSHAYEQFKSLIERKEQELCQYL